MTQCFSHVGTLCPWNIENIICFTIVLRDNSEDLVCVGGRGGTHWEVQAKERGGCDLHTGQEAVEMSRRGATSKDCYSHQAPGGASSPIQPPHSQFTEMPGADHKGEKRGAWEARGHGTACDVYFSPNIQKSCCAVPGSGRRFLAFTCSEEHEGRQRDQAARWGRAGGTER